LAATHLPTLADDDHHDDGDDEDRPEHFVTLQQSHSGEVVRGVAFPPHS
jgi:hypothetical protein